MHVGKGISFLCYLNRGTILTRFHAIKYINNHTWRRWWRHCDIKDGNGWKHEQESKMQIWEVQSTSSKHKYQSKWTIQGGWIQVKMAETMATMVTHDSHTLKRVVMVGMFFHMPLESNWIVDWPIGCVTLCFVDQC